MPERPLIPYAGKEQGEAYWQRRRKYERSIDHAKRMVEHWRAELARLERAYRELYGFKHD